MPPHPKGRNRPAPWAVAALMALVAWTASAPARAQGPAYCNITRISAVRLSNGVQVTVQADGLMNVQWDVADYLDMASVERDDWDNVTRPIDTLPFRITNARPRVDSLTDIGLYPVSHVEVSVPPEAPEGIGVNLRIALFAPARVLSLRTPYGFQFGDPYTGVATASVYLSADRTRLVAIIGSDRRTHPPAKPRRPPADAPSELSVTAHGEEVSIRALNADLRDLVRALAARTGRDLVADGGLDRIVSLSLPAIPVDEALDALALAYGLSLHRDGPSIRMSEGMANNIPAYGQTSVASIRLNHISAVSARNSLPDFLLGAMRVDPAQNALTVFGPPALVEKVRRDVAALDLPIPQVSVEAQIVEFASSEDADRLLDAETTGGGLSVAVRPGTGDITVRTGDDLPDDIAARLHALVREGRAKVRARPRAVALSGRTARLFVGRQQYIKVQSWDVFEEAYIARIMSVDLGAALRVTPWTAGGPDILLDVEPSVSDIAEREPVTGLPTVNTRSARATVRVRSGETVVVGGLDLPQRQHLRRKVPIFGDLPFVGALFRAPARNRSHTSTIMLVTARLVDDATPAPSEPGPSVSARSDPAPRPHARTEHTL